MDDRKYIIEITQESSKFKDSLHTTIKNAEDKGHRLLDIFYVERGTFAMKAFLLMQGKQLEGKGGKKVVDIEKKNHANKEYVEDANKIDVEDVIVEIDEKANNADTEVADEVETNPKTEQVLRRLVSEPKLLMDAKYRNMMVDGYKTVTTRKGIRTEFEIGKTYEIEWTHNYEGPVEPLKIEVVSLLVTRFGDIKHSTAFKAGHRSVKDYQDSIRTYYQINDSTVVTHVEFKTL